jgi:NAD-dependent deacetylase
MPQPEDRSIVILTGAGISKESGLETFRDPDGIWARVSIDEVATPEAFARDPAPTTRSPGWSATGPARCCW